MTLELAEGGRSWHGPTHPAQRLQSSSPARCA
jgi:hypothetical protein